MNDHTTEAPPPAQDGSEPAHPETEQPGLSAVSAALSSAQPVSTDPGRGGRVSPPDLPPIGDPDKGGGQPQDCPVTPLGYSAGRYSFLSPDGEERTLTTRDMTPRGIVSLFAGRKAWLIKNFPARDKEGEIRPGQFSAPAAADWLIEACHMFGFHDNRLPRRGIGVWPLSDNRRAGPLAHCGDLVLVWRGDLRRFEERPPGFRTTTALYPIKARVPAPDLAAPMSRGGGGPTGAGAGALEF